MLEKVWRKGNPLTLLVRMKTSTVTMKNMWRFLKKLEKELPYDPAIPLLGIHTEESRIEGDRCHMYPNVHHSTVYNSEDLEDVNDLEPPVSIGVKMSLELVIKEYRWKRKLWYIYTMEYYSAIKKNAFESVLMR